MGTSKPRLIAIVGPTATGKSDLAVRVALLHSGEVISADARQVYRGLDVGTGKITPEEMRGIPHHLLDVVDPADTYTVQQFQLDGRTHIDDIVQRGALPIVAGGTGHYVDVLLYDGTIPEVPPNEALRSTLNKETPEALFTQLQTADPRRAATIEPNNKRRLVRALEIVAALGVVPEATKPVLHYQTLFIGIDLPDELLKERISARTAQRLEHGWIEEVERLIDEGVPAERFNEFGLGYNYIAQNYSSIRTNARIVEDIAALEWKYVKRQRTWFRKNTDVRWFDARDSVGALECVADFLSDE